MPAGKGGQPHSCHSNTHHPHYKGNKSPGAPSGLKNEMRPIFYHVWTIGAVWRHVREGIICINAERTWSTPKLLVGFGKGQILEWTHEVSATSNIWPHGMHMVQFYSSVSQQFIQHMSESDNLKLRRKKMYCNLHLSSSVLCAPTISCQKYAFVETIKLFA